MAIPKHRPEAPLLNGSIDLKSKLSKVVKEKVNPRERARLDTPAQVLREFQRLYRRLSNKELPPHEMKTRTIALRALLDVMSNMPAITSVPTLTINLIAVPTGRFLSEQDAIAARVGRSLIDVEDRKPLLLEDLTPNNDAEQTIEQPINQTNISGPKSPEVEVVRSRRQLRDAAFRDEFKLGS
jgi:hypothetical protein